MALIRGKDWWWNYFKSNFYDMAQHIRGNIVLPYGQQVVTVPIDKKIKNVYVYADPGSAIPVCFGDLNYLAVTHQDFSFNIYANINTAYATIYWLVEFNDGE